MARSLLRLLDSARWLAPLLAVALALPSIGGGLIADDWFHRAHFDPRSVVPGGRGPLLDLFAFFPRDRQDLLAWRDVGVLPWWVDPAIRGAFLRPLTAATHLLDWRLFGEIAWPAHVHNLAWMALAVVCVGALYREWIGGRAAALATLLFAVDDAHAWPVAWIANRNSLLVLVFGSLTALLHLRARTRGAAWLAALPFGAALLSAEAGTATALLLATIELSRPEPGRLRRLAPYAAVGLAWALAWKLGGYGLSGSGLYIDPTSTPLRFLLALPERMGALLGAVWLNLPVDLWVALPPGLSLPLGLGLGALVVAGVMGLRPRTDRPIERELLIASVVCLLPTIAAFPMERVTSFAGIAVFGWMGVVLAPALEAGLPRWRERLTLGWHLPAAATLLAVKAWGMSAIIGQVGAAFDVLPDDPVVTGQDVVYVVGLDLATAYVPLTRALQGRPVPRAQTVLAPASATLRVTREDARTLRLEVPGGMFARAVDRLCREAPMPAGTAVQTDVATMEVLADQEGRPTEVRVRFPEDLESPRYRWLAPHDRAFLPWAPPAIGEVVVVGPFL